MRDITIGVHIYLLSLFCLCIISSVLSCSTQHTLYVFYESKKEVYKSIIIDIAARARYRLRWTASYIQIVKFSSASPYMSQRTQAVSILKTNHTTYHRKNMLAFRKSDLFLLEFNQARKCSKLFFSKNHDDEMPRKSMLRERHTDRQSSRQTNEQTGMMRLYSLFANALRTCPITILYQRTVSWLARRANVCVLVSKSQCEIYL